MDIEKAFDSLDHDFLITVLNKFAFGSNFISWFKLLLNSQQSCVINGGNTTPFFNPISTRRGRRGGVVVQSTTGVYFCQELLNGK